jgi:cellulose 1,4-beta-cellobiosidase
VAVSALETPGTVDTSYNTTTAAGTWDDSYDIWWNADETTNNNQSGLEMMIWLNRQGGVQPKGSVVASNVSIDGATYNVWYGTGTVSYVATTPVTSVSNLDLGPFAADAVSRSYMTSAWYLIDVEAGFEVWQGGAGLTANSFSVDVK